MATQANWELDPETRTKLATLQKKEGTSNDRCCDCGAPSPQWASPKFAIFICLQCAGTHRGLGVHISFVRSISMDAFKSTEIKRMQLGGNKAWQNFFNANSKDAQFEDCTIKERYDSEVGEEYKERLTAKAEDREFDMAKFQKERAIILEKIAAKEKSRSATPAGVGRTGTGSNIGSRTQSPAPGRGAIDPAQKAQNEAFFARMGNANATRPDNLPPSQGGKYAGFGSSVPGPAEQETSSIPSANDFQKDPVAALTRGFGWLSSTVAKSAKTVNESYIQPTAKNIASTDFASQAQKGLSTVSTTVAAGAKGATEQFHKFVEGQDNAASTSAAARSGGRNVEPERKDFWDSFGMSNDSPPSKSSSSIGTNAMRKTSANDTTVKKKKEDGWGDDW